MLLFEPLFREAEAIYDVLLAQEWDRAERDTGDR